MTPDALIAQERLPASYRDVVTGFWQPLSREIARRRPRIVGINGAQGSGKTTACRFLEALLAEQGLTAVTLALDDLYLTRAEREALARDEHPLFLTRGVPGTHDVDLGMKVLDDLLAGRPTELPVFDKATDDRSSAVRLVQGPVDVVLFEGWCVGAAPQPAAALREPVNDLEATEDPDGAWRREVNRRLATDYAELFARIELMIMLKVPDFSVVKANRLRQEQKLGQGPAVLDEGSIHRFISHYERITRWLLEDLATRSDIVIAIGPDQNPVSSRPALGDSAVS